MELEDIRAGMTGITWYHTIDLGHGIVTPGIDDTPLRIPPLGLPDDLSGWTVLDIGAWDGALSFEAERRGAARVLATDSYCWSGEGWGSKAGFEFVRRALGSQVEDMDIDVMDLSPARVGTFDLVLLVGVLYHLRHPLLALERVASVTEKLLILDTHVAAVRVEQPVMIFYPDAELNDDPTELVGTQPRRCRGHASDGRFLEGRANQSSSSAQAG